MERYKGGWAGQGIMVNPVHDYVFVWNSYFKDKDESDKINTYNVSSSKELNQRK